jgi:tRNA dimethylallyltransferase
MNTTDKNKLLIVVAGPTASGKTGMAISLAKYFNTEIISADSRQFYREIPIGTAAPTAEQMALVPHHFVGNLSISDNYNVSQYEKEVLGLLSKKFETLPVMVMAGGSGLYIDAVCKGIDKLPDPDPKLRAGLHKLFEENGLVALQEILLKLDPAFYQQVDKNNPKRLLRAIEVCQQTGKKYSDLRQNKAAKRPFNILKIGLEIQREQLNQRINKRTEQMMAAGWLEEARAVYPFRQLNALNTVGYKELFAHFDGQFTLDEAIEKIKTNTRRYAKRQMTWFRKDESMHWFHPDALSQIIGLIEQQHFV